MTFFPEVFQIGIYPIWHHVMDFPWSVSSGKIRIFVWISILPLGGDLLWNKRIVVEHHCALLKYPPPPGLNYCNPDQFDLDLTSLPLPLVQPALERGALHKHKWDGTAVITQIKSNQIANKFMASKLRSLLNWQKGIVGLKFFDGLFKKRPNVCCDQNAQNKK